MPETGYWLVSLTGKNQPEGFKSSCRKRFRQELFSAGSFPDIRLRMQYVSVNG